VPFTVATVNVNGVRAAVRRGMGPWLAAREPDLLLLQEVRAPTSELERALGAGWHVAHAEAEGAGRAGVAVASRRPVEAVRIGLGVDGADDSGRWIEADVRVGDAVLTAVSAYVHTGEAGTPRQEVKYAFLAGASARLLAAAADGRHVLLCGDLNIAHREADLKNWKGNLKKSGFLTEERAWLDDVLALGWSDVLRDRVGPGPGPYSWWSWRGQAFDNDTGWRIDYQIASPSLAPHALKAEIDRAPSYAERWSDHAPVVVTYDLPNSRSS
jgi:exodeoxyribonuclease-3